MRFRKKPIVIEAHQHDGESIKQSWPEWLRVAYAKGEVYEGGKSFGDLYIKTLEGIMAVNKDDWIIQGVKGEIYPCKPDIFGMTYDRIDTEDIVALLFK